MRWLLPCVLVLATSCSLAFQDSVRSSGVYCSTSRFYHVSDLLLAGSYVALAASYGAPAETYIPAAPFVGSALIGRYKRGNCVRHREHATPEMWERDAARERRNDEARARAMSELAERLREPPPSPAPSPSSSVAPQPSTTSSYDRPPPGIEVTVERHMPADELGRSCTSDNHTDRDIPTAGTCRYGAVCYQGRCTVSCRHGDDSCPSGTSCAWTDGQTKFEVCR